MTVLVLASGCLTAQLNGARELIEAHPKGFSDAVNAIAEAEAFVRTTLRKVNRLEEMVKVEYLEFRW